MLLEDLLHDSRTSEELIEDIQKEELEFRRYKEDIYQQSRERIKDYREGFMGIKEIEERKGKENEELDTKYKPRLKNLRLNRKFLRTNYNIN